MMWGYGYEMNWMWPIFGLLVVVGIVAIVLVFVFSRDGLSSRDDRSQERDADLRARQILDERYARGEIETAEYRERRHALEDGT